jgi:hypothetical protein
VAYINYSTIKKEKLEDYWRKYFFSNKVEKRKSVLKFAEEEK